MTTSSSGPLGDSAKPSMTHLRRAGIVVAALSVGGLLVSAAMVIAAFVSTFSSSMSGPSYNLPVDVTVTLTPGTWVVFEQTGVQRANGPVTVTNGKSPILSAASLRITGPSGDTIAARSLPARTSQTINRYGQIHTGVARFEVMSTGKYSIQIPVEPGAVVIAPDMGMSLRAAVPGIMVGGVSGVALLVSIILIVRGRRPVSAGHHDPSLPLPGWHPDPRRPGEWLWWDGAQWHAAAPDRRESPPGQ